MHSRGSELLSGRAAKHRSPTRQLLPKNLSDSLGKILWWFPVKKERGGGGGQRHELNKKNASYQTFQNKEKGLEFHIFRTGVGDYL